MTTLFLLLTSSTDLTPNKHVWCMQVILISSGVSGIADAAEPTSASGYVIVPPRSLPEALFQEAENLIDLIRNREVFGEAKLMETVERGKSAIETAQVWANVRPWQVVLHLFYS